MKKPFSMLILLFVIVCALSTATAADLSGFKAHAPTSIDLSPFENEAYGCTFDSFQYRATITAKALATYKTAFINSIVKWSKFRLEIYMSTHEDQLTRRPYQSYIPRLVASYVYEDSYRYDDLFMLIGEHRYRFNMNKTGVALLGKPAFAILEEITTTNNEVRVSFESISDQNYSYVLTSENIETIRKFVEDCKRSGIYNGLSSNDDSSIITHFD